MEAIRDEDGEIIEWEWSAYADDIVVDAEEEEKVEKVLRQLEVCCGFIGLRLNADKTEVMPLNLAPKRVPQGDARVETIAESKDEGEGRMGKLVDYQGAKFIIEKEQRESWENRVFIKTEATHYFKWDDENDWHPIRLMSGTTRSRIRIIDEDGSSEEKYVYRLGIYEHADPAKTRHGCDRCGQMMYDAVTLKGHRARGDCRISPTKKESLRKKGYMLNMLKNRGVVERFEEEVKVGSSTNDRLPCCNKFKYLGTSVAPGQGIAPEISGRAGIASGIAAGLKKVWRCKRIGRRLKKEAFEMLILSVLLYNAETWWMSQREEAILEQWYIKIARATIGARNRHWESETRDTNEQCLKKLGLQTVKQLLFQRRVIWIAHVARREEMDEGAREMLNARHDESDRWWTMVKRDLNARGCTVDQVLEFRNSQAELKKRVLSVDLQEASAA